jgi:hypothetical protein
LCGRQGARGVANPALLESFIDAPAAYSTTGREAFRRQQEQAIRNAARVAGRRNRSGSSRTGGTTTSSGAGRGGSGFEDSQRTLSSTQRTRRPRRPGRPRQRPKRHRRCGILTAMIPPFVAVGRSHQAWTDIGASPWLVRQLRFGLQLPWTRRPQTIRAREYCLSPEDLEFARSGPRAGCN